MKYKSTPYIYILFFLLSSGMIFGQNYKLKIEVKSASNKDALPTERYRENFSKIDSLKQEIHLFEKKLELNGYLNSRLDSLVQKDSLYTAYINMSNKIEYIYISHGHISKDILSEKELQSLPGKLIDGNIKIQFSTLNSFMQSLVDIFETKGNSFVQFSLANIELINNEAKAKLVLDLKFKRYIDKIVIKGYENFPDTYINHELDLKIGSLFNKNKIENASKSINNLPFAQESKPPEVLFTNDSTIIYLYLKKKKSNQFDGIIGFASKENEDGLEFNGYLDLAVNNIFNAGETIAVYWKNNGNDRQRFYLDAELPYVFNLPITPRANFELYRQDSTFNNTTFNFGLIYNVVGKGKITAQLNTENSNDLTNGISPGVASYSNLFYGLSYSYNKLSSDQLFPSIFTIYLSGLFGSRKSESQNTSQTKFLFTADYLYAINEKNYLFLKNSSGLLLSENYLENELFRFGGIYNLRGVNEESIFASSYTVFNFEYRFKPNFSSYFYTITDYSYSENKLIDNDTSVISLGLGYAMQTKVGILNLSYALGKFDNEPITFNDSKIHIKIVSNF